MSCTLCATQGIPCIHSLTTTNACDACRQAHKKCLFVVQPFRSCSQRSSRPRHPCEDSFVVNDDERIPKREWTLGPQTGRRENFWKISPMTSSIDLSTPPQMVTLLLDQSKVIIQPMKDGDGKKTLELGPIVTMSCYPWNSNAKNKNHQIPHDKTHPFLICLASKLRGNPLQARVAPNGQRTYSVNNEPPILGPSQPSKPQQGALTCEPEPEVAPTQSMEEPFGCRSGYPCLHNNHRQYTRWLLPRRSLPVPSSPHSHDDACQEFTGLQPTLMIPQAIFHDSIQGILLEHHRLLHMIPFVDATPQNEMHQEFWEELNTLLGQALEAYPKEDITGIFLKK
ncbi:hypothetical protein O181_018880 [Austropuccinia psidii MF-1]|uniref:Zn(2)-C6 fungal-type domain-containing protein n=1 Tax=Austropuccinia psidii MF-1 TaxID=1389203 RepID=A0A9Q3C9I5_9BASI|nr:hypothetical protein [Austropuccinia psidii MF-1]